MSFSKENRQIPLRLSMLALIIIQSLTAAGVLAEQDTSKPARNSRPSLDLIDPTTQPPEKSPQVEKIRRQLLSLEAHYYYNPKTPDFAGLYVTIPMEFGVFPDIEPGKPVNHYIRYGVPDSTWDFFRTDGSSLEITAHHDDGSTTTTEVETVEGHLQTADDVTFRDTPDNPAPATISIETDGSIVTGTSALVNGGEFVTTGHVFFDEDPSTNAQLFAIRNIAGQWEMVIDPAEYKGQYTLEVGIASVSLNDPEHPDITWPREWVSPDDAGVAPLNLAEESYIAWRLTPIDQD